MTLGVDGLVEQILLCPRGIVWNDGLCAFCGDNGSEGVGIVGCISHDEIGRKAFNERLGLRSIAGLACRQEEPDRTAQAADSQMDFGRQAAARSSDGLILSPPFAPLAC